MTSHHLGRDRSEHDVQRLACFLRGTLLEHVDGTRQAIDDVRIRRSLLESRAGKPLSHLRLDAEPVLVSDHRHDYVYHGLLAALRPALHGAKQPATVVVQEALLATLQLHVRGLVIDRLGSSLLLARLEVDPMLDGPALRGRLPRFQRGLLHCRLDGS